MKRFIQDDADNQRADNGGHFSCELWKADHGGHGGQREEESGEANFTPVV